MSAIDFVSGCIGGKTNIKTHTKIKSKVILNLKTNFVFKNFVFLVKTNML